MTVEIKNYQQLSTLSKAAKMPVGKNSSIKAFQHHVSLLLSPTEKELLICILKEYKKTHELKQFVCALKEILTTKQKQTLYQDVRNLIPRVHIADFDHLVNTKGHKAGKLPNGYIPVTHPPSTGLLDPDVRAKPTVHVIEIDQSNKTEDGGFELYEREKQGGMYVGTVKLGSAAEKAGLTVGDEILTVNNINVRDLQLSAEAVMEMAKSRKMIQLCVQRGKIVTGIPLPEMIITWFDVRLNKTIPDPDAHLTWDLLCEHNSPERTVNLELKNMKEIGFNIRGGSNYGLGIYVSNVDPNSLADIGGLQPGDKILAVNGQSFLNITHDSAVQFLMRQCYLALIVRNIGRYPICQESVAKHSTHPSKSEHKNEVGTGRMSVQAEVQIHAAALGSHPSSSDKGYCSYPPSMDCARKQDDLVNLAAGPPHWVPAVDTMQKASNTALPMVKNTETYTPYMEIEPFSDLKLNITGEDEVSNIIYQTRIKQADESLSDLSLEVDRPLQSGTTQVNDIIVVEEKSHLYRESPKNVPDKQNAIKLDEVPPERQRVMAVSCKNATRTTNWSIVKNVNSEKLALLRPKSSLVRSPDKDSLVHELKEVFEQLAVNADVALPYTPKWRSEGGAFFPPNGMIPAVLEQNGVENIEEKIKELEERQIFLGRKEVSSWSSAHHGESPKEPQFETVYEESETEPPFWKSRTGPDMHMLHLPGQEMVMGRTQPAQGNGNKAGSSPLLTDPPKLVGDLEQDKMTILKSMAQMLLEAEEYKFVMVHIEQYLDNRDIETLVQQLLMVLNKPEKLILLRNVRNIIFPFDLGRYDSMIGGQEGKAFKSLTSLYIDQASPKITHQSRNLKTTVIDDEGRFQLKSIQQYNKDVKSQKNVIDTLFSSKVSVSPKAHRNDSEDSDIVTVYLSKQIRTLGITITGGIDCKRQTEVRIDEICPGGAAAEEKKLQAGMIILFVDDEPVDGATHREAVFIIRKTFTDRRKPVMKMVLKRQDKHNYYKSH